MFQLVTRRLAAGAGARAFSGSACSFKATGPLPVFTSTSNPELDKLLSTIQEELFIPSHLLRRHKTLQHRQRNHHILAEEPLTVDVSGVPVTLTAKSREVPVPIKLFTRALGLMQQPGDLDAIPGLVQGYAQANRRIRDEQAEKLARMCNFHGRTDILMTLARTAGKNGFRFSRPAAREFMRGLRMAAMLPGKEASVKAIKNGQALLNCLGEPLMKVRPDERLKRDPVVVGTLLSMVASTSVKFNEGKDYENRTRQWVHRLQACWEDVEWYLDLTPKGAGDRNPVYRAKAAVLDYLPVLEGLFAARDMLQGTDQSAWLEAESAKLNNTVAGWKKFLDENSPGEQFWGVHAYKRVAERLAKEKELAAEVEGEVSDEVYEEAEEEVEDEAEGKVKEV